MIDDHRSRFYGLDIEQYQPSKGIQHSGKAIRIEVDYDDADKGVTIVDRLTALSQDTQVAQVKALIVGAWEEAYDTSIQSLLDLLVVEKDVFSHLEALFIGDMISEECEISWIQQGNYESIWEAFPKLQHVQVRGMEGLNFGDIHHAGLTTLIVETGGLSRDLAAQIAKANLPSLSTLELWFGEENYGGNCATEDIAPFTQKERFPQLNVLGLMNSEIQNDIAKLIVNASILPQLNRLNLSMGTMTDEGAQVLLDNADKLAHLSLLDLSHHYLSDAMMEKIQSLPCPVDVSGQEATDEDDGDVYRYVAVSE